MRSKKELKNFLKACEAVQGFGMSSGPCPLNAGERTVVKNGEGVLLPHAFKLCEEIKIGFDYSEG